MRRVVVTGLGMVSPLGVGVDVNWRRLTAGESGIGKANSMDVSDLPCKIAGQIPWRRREGESDADITGIPPKEQKRMGAFMLFAAAAANEAIKDAGCTPTSDGERERIGVLVGAGIGGLNRIEEGAIELYENGPRHFSPFFLPSALINHAGAQVAIMHGYRGPNFGVVSACASGAHAIGEAARMVALDDADVMIAGGTESAVGRLGLASFCALRALSTGFNDTPTKASRPFDRDRDGFVMGEGSGILVLEEYEHAKKRGTKIYAEIAGYGLSGDAHHLIAPPEDGNGGYRAMQMALRHAHMNPGDVDYINAHGTSTPLGDEAELKAVKRLFGDAVGNVTMSSTKSSIGHLLGAAGAVEAIYSILAIQNGIVPPTLNLNYPSESCEGIDLVPHHAKEIKIRTVMSNSFGFGGTNACLIFKELS